jgi:hypothetical protein
MIFRPEALESVFIMYRITGDRSLQDTAWRMFQNIDKATRTKFGHSTIKDIRHKKPSFEDKMESFWLAETLKYLYLIFSEPDHISLDDYVLWVLLLFTSCTYTNFRTEALKPTPSDDPTPAVTPNPIDEIVFSHRS